MDVKPVLFLLMVAVALSLAQQPSKPCCYPPLFEISVGTTTGVAYFFRTYAVNEVSEMALDSNNSMAAYITTTFQEATNTTIRTVLQYGKDSVKYEIDERERKCQAFPLQGNISSFACVDASATFYGSVYLGNNKLTIDSFANEVRDRQQRGWISESVTQGDCIPNSWQFQGKFQGASVLSVSGFFNYKDGIANPSKFFNIPSYCSPELLSEKSTLRKEPFPHFLPFLF